MNLAATLRGTTYSFRDLKEVLAKANEEKSGDGWPASPPRRRRSASPPSCVLAEVTLKERHARTPSSRYEKDAVTRLIHRRPQPADLRRREVLDGRAAA